MKRTISTLLVAGLLGCGMQVMAQDTSSKAPDPASPSSAGQMSEDSGTSDHKGMSKSQKAFMKECMDKARQSNNGMSEADMKKSCKDQLKANMGQEKPVTPAH